LLLTLRAADVPERVGVAHAREGEGGGAVGLMAPGRPDEFAVGVVDVVVEAELHPSHGVDHVCDPAHADLDVVVHLHPGELFDRLDEQRGAAEGERCVQLPGPVAGDVDVRVAREGDERRRPVRRDGQEHDRVGALALGAVRDRAVGAGVRAGEQVDVPGRPRRFGEGIDVLDLPVGPDEQADGPGQNERGDEGDQDGHAAEPNALTRDTAGWGALLGCPHGTSSGRDA